MSNSHFVYCACWDPWNVRGRRLIKTSQHMQPASVLQSPLLGQPSSEVARYASICCYCKNAPLRTPAALSRVRESLLEAPGEFIEISPGYTLTRSKEHLSVTLGEEFFERKVNLANEMLQPIKMSKEDVITDLEEQIAELSDMMEQLRRDHQASRKLLEKDMEEKCNEMRQEHGNKIRELQEAHRAELQALQEFYKKELKTERATAQEKMEGMQKEYKYLKNAFRMYQDSVSDEMEEKWLRRQVDWKKSERTEREKALLQQKQELMKKFELEKEQLRKSLRSGDTMMNKDIEDYIKQHQADEKKIQELQSIKESLTVEVKEKDQILTALTATMQNAQVELKKEKSNLLAMEKSIQEKISAVELKHQLNISSLTDENVVLR
uniref:Flagellum associated containing coiled-coil domains 1 n=1 Tax=Pelodiscus sinensis TaxID=13735 RepID=K7FLL4_PELSI